MNRKGERMMNSLAELTKSNIMEVPGVLAQNRPAFGPKEPNKNYEILHPFWVSSILIITSTEEAKS